VGTVLIRSLIKGALIIALSWLALSYLSRSKTVAEDFALGEQTVTYQAKKDGHLIHIIRLQEDELEDFERGYEERGQRPSIFILGNSQTHAINQKQPDDVTYVELLHNRWVKRGMDVQTMSMPNINLGEMLLGYQYLSRERDVRLAIIPVFYDDLREWGLRKAYLGGLASKGISVPSDWRSAKALQASMEILTNDPEGADNAEHAGIRETTQAISEHYLDSSLSEKSAIWRKRSTMRSDFFIALYQLRNSAFGINAQTIRRVPSDLKTQNIHALLDLLDLCKKDETKVILYIPPLRNDVTPPYDMTQYEQFKTELEQIASKYSNVHFTDLEDLIPGKYWGTKGSTSLDGTPEYDFMHFQFPGHQRLDSALNKEIEQILKK
jgi:hypothetical protein